MKERKKISGYATGKEKDKEREGGGGDIDLHVWEYIKSSTSILNKTRT